MMMRIISGFTLLLFGLASAQTPPATKAAPVPPPPGVWAKLDQTLNTGFSRAGDKISAVLQDEAAVKDVKLPKGTKLTGTVMKSVNQDKAHPTSGLVLVFDSAVLKNGTTMPVKVTMASIAPSHSDEVEQVTLGSGAAAGSGPIAGRTTDANWITATEMGGMSDPNESKTAHSSNDLGGMVTTSSIKGVTLIASPTAKFSGVVMAADGPLQLTKWTRINMLVSPR
jgi:hypothetical protein